MFTFEDTISKIDLATLNKIIEIGKMPDLEPEERAAVRGHRMADQSRLLRENYVVHRNSLTVTKVLEYDLDIVQFLRDVIDCCNFPSKVFFGK